MKDEAHEIKPSEPHAHQVRFFMLFRTKLYLNRQHHSNLYRAITKRSSSIHFRCGYSCTTNVSHFIIVKQSEDPIHVHRKSVSRAPVYFDDGGCRDAFLQCGVCKMADDCNAGCALFFPMTTLLCGVSFGQCSNWWTRTLCGTPSVPLQRSSQGCLLVAGSVYRVFLDLVCLLLIASSAFCGRRGASTFRWACCSSS